MTTLLDEYNATRILLNSNVLSARQRAHLNDARMTLAKALDDATFEQRRTAIARIRAGREDIEQRRWNAFVHGKSLI